MPLKSDKKYVRCTEGFILGRSIVKGGQVLAANDRMVKGREHLFQPLDDDDTIREATTPLNDRQVGGRKHADKVVSGRKPLVVKADA